MTELFHAVGIRNIWQFAAATMLFLMLPGPGTFCVLSSTAQRGVRGGFASVFGLMLGDVVFMFLAAAGIGATLQANPILFKGLQYFGSGYLAYLGIQLLRAKKEQRSIVVPFSDVADFQRGLLVALVNPKAIVFYMAFFPLFIDLATHRGATTFIAMGMVIISCILFYGSLLVLVGNAATRRLSHNGRIAAVASKAAGIFLIGFGIKLSIS